MSDSIDYSDKAKVIRRRNYNIQPDDNNYDSQVANFILREYSGKSILDTT